MSLIQSPIFDFNELIPNTITSIADYEADEFNLSAIFALLITTNKDIKEEDRVIKQGKVVIPKNFDKYGTILSMRFGKEVRGIVRSEITKSFPNSIIMDIVTEDRNISVKFNRPNIEITGARNKKIIEDVISIVINMIKEAQRSLDLYKTGEVTQFVKDRLENCKTEEDREGLLDFLSNYDEKLYIGTLNITNITFEMTNILFELGFSVNLHHLSLVMNREPLICKYTNGTKKSSPAVVLYNYKKINRSGKEKDAKFTIRIYKTGHVKFSGAGLDKMEIIYYTFMKRIINNIDYIKSINKEDKNIKLGEWRLVDKYTFRDKIDKEDRIRQSIINNEIPTLD